MNEKTAKLIGKAIRESFPFDPRIQEKLKRELKKHWNDLPSEEREELRKKIRSRQGLFDWQTKAQVVEK